MHHIILLPSGTFLAISAVTILEGSKVLYVPSCEWLLYLKVFQKLQFIRNKKIPTDPFFEQILFNVSPEGLVESLALRVAVHRCPTEKRFKKLKACTLLRAFYLKFSKIFRTNSFIEYLLYFPVF